MGKRKLTVKDLAILDQVQSAQQLAGLLLDEHGADNLESTLAELQAGAGLCIETRMPARGAPTIELLLCRANGERVSLSRVEFARSTVLQ